ncbi:class I SAM-dependent methyltransferase [Williamsia sp. CHRR-6]|uniref:class I SAM-dependent methyltransferase n=1 Tax=Williamsia sp. CHRR-6 TaxID=2835871 RepID=UPI001BD9FBAA|nr:class I SAM-dependent methyltransferase [Williamsia sp. CHRR-6]MBT0566274.1 transferase [Williamsia sp. CHRR-6]
MRCRGCGSDGCVTVLDVGRVPAADHFPSATEPFDPSENANPLAMAVCPTCGLAQLEDDDTVTDEPRGIEPQALRDQAEAAVSDVAAAGLLHGGTVAEFGSPHGGTWLPLLTERGFTPIDSARSGAADVVLDCFGIMHDADQSAAFARRAALTAPTGVLLLQFHSITTIVTEGQWNALRHGHFAYYSLTSITRLLARQAMVVTRVWEYDLYGGTILLAAAHAATGAQPDESVHRILTREEHARVDDPGYTAALQQICTAQWDDLRGWLVDASARGQRVYAYGAASRAVALFSGARLTSHLLCGVADASPGKQGRRMPGTDIPIISPEELVAATPDAVLVTVPDLVDEVARRFPTLAPMLCTEPKKVSA